MIDEEMRKRATAQVQSTYALLKLGDCVQLPNTTAAVLGEILFAFAQSEVEAAVGWEREVILELYHRMVIEEDASIASFCKAIRARSAKEKL